MTEWMMGYLSFLTYAAVTLAVAFVAAVIVVALTRPPLDLDEADPVSRQKWEEQVYEPANSKDGRE